MWTLRELRGSHALGSLELGLWIVRGNVSFPGVWGSRGCGLGFPEPFRVWSFGVFARVRWIVDEEGGLSYHRRYVAYIYPY